MASRMSSTPRPPVISPCPRLEILGTVIDEMIDAERAHFVVLCGRRSADDRRADMLGDLRCGNSDAATGRMDEHRLAALEPAHDDEQLPGGEIVHRHRRGFHRRHAGGRGNTWFSGTEITSE